MSVWTMSEGPIDFKAGWEIVKIHSAMTSTKLKSKYCIPDYIELLVLEAYERACSLRPGRVAIIELMFKSSNASTFVPLL